MTSEISSPHTYIGTALHSWKRNTEHNPSFILKQNLLVSQVKPLETLVADILTQFRKDSTMIWPSDLAVGLFSPLPPEFLVLGHATSYCYHQQTMVCEYHR